MNWFVLALGVFNLAMAVVNLWIARKNHEAAKRNNENAKTNLYISRDLMAQMEQINAGLRR